MSQVKQAEEQNTNEGNFSFNEENLQKANTILSRYPAERKQSGMIPLLDLAQRQNGGWLSKDALVYVANFLEVPEIRVFEVATFYTMFNLKPVGKHFIQVCTTTPCWLRGSDQIVDTCKKKLGIDFGQTSEDGEFSMLEVECLGACVNAPMVQINDDFYEDLDPDIMETIIEDLRAGKEVKMGSQTGRQCSAPVEES